MTVSQGVFLDLGSVDNGDLDTAALDRSLPGWQWFDFTAAGEVSERIGLADVVVTNKCVLDRKTLARAENLKLIAIAATGTDVVDLEASATLGIAVCNIRNYATRSVVQHVLTLMLNLVTGQQFYADRVRRGDWSKARQFSLHDQPIRELPQLQLGIIGYGVLGRAVEKAARALDMNVLIAEHRGSEPRPDRLAFRDVLKTADVISIHCPLSDATRGLFDHKVFRAMKPGAILINTARGGIVVEADLADALRAGEIAGAGVDTLSTEPPPVDHPLLAGDIPNLIVTPHNAWASQSARQACLDQVKRVINAFNRGQPLNRIV